METPCSRLKGLMQKKRKSYWSHKNTKFEICQPVMVKNYAHHTFYNQIFIGLWGINTPAHNTKWQKKNDKYYQC